MVARRPFPPRKRFRLRRLQRLLFGAAPARAGARRTRLAKADSGLTKETTPVAPASPRKDGIEKVQEHVKVQLEKSYKNFQASRGAGDLQQFDARTAVKRVVPRYARINGLVPGVTWGEVQRQLQRTGHTFWRPSLSEKRQAVRRPEGLEGSVPAGKKIYYRDVHLPDVLVFRPMGQSCVDDVNLFDEGALVFQQKASMFPALALEPAPGAQVIDACAAPGSKTSQMAAMMKNEGTIFAFDRDGRRLRTMMNLLKQRHVTCVEACEKDFLQSSPEDARYRNVTHFLLDPSCSSSGMTAQPISDDLAVKQLAENQKKVILHAMRFPACERIAYSTCSIYEEENEKVVQHVLQDQLGAHFELEATLPWWPRRGSPKFEEVASRCVRSSWEDQTIGFFCALFVKEEPSVRDRVTGRPRQAGFTAGQAVLVVGGPEWRGGALLEGH